MTDVNGSTLLGDVSDQAQTFWSNLFVPELLAGAKLPAVVNRAYEGEIKEGGSTVRVSQILRPTATIKTVGAGEESFEASKMQTLKVDVTADRVITAAFKFSSLVQLQSQIGSKDSEIRAALVSSVTDKLNDYLYSLVAPSTSAPDHSIASVTDFNQAALATVRKLASQAKWPEQDRWLFLDPSYYNDFLAVAALTSADYVTDSPVMSGKVSQRYGFNVVEDNNASMLRLTAATATEDFALGFHKDFMYLVMQQAPTIEVSSLHSQEQHGFLISAKLVVGAKLGIAGNVKHVVTYNT